ncbi:MAG: M48 family metallopeptidase [Candidatus Omnitrophica bacterium]|nr:M48 family metallopeptidase [Candidatus Omnitrophota bacterium]
MGNDLHKSLTREYSFSTNIDKVNRLQEIGQRLSKVSDRQDYEYHFYLIEKDDLNAFATPGGFVYVYTGLFDKLKTDDAIASVVAHEIGHCAARHIAKKFQAALGYNIIGVVVLSQVNAEAQAIAAQSSDVAMNLVFSAFSRQDEYQADSLGIKYLCLAGYNPNGMIESFEVLKKEEKGDFVPLWLRTHPYIDDRIKRVKEEAVLAPYRYGRFETKPVTK